MKASERRAHAVVLFADMSGSVAMYASHGDTAAFRLNAACLTLLEQCVKANGGRVIRKIGDSVLAVFDEADNAVRSAAQMQSQLNDPEEALRKAGVRIRVGLCSGIIVHGKGDIYGDSVNVAARLVALAGPDEVLIAGDVYDDLTPAVQMAARPIEALTLRGRPLPVAAYELHWRHQEDVTVAIGARPRRSRTALTLIFQEEKLVVDADHPKITIGRAEDNDIVIEATLVSRHHADVSLRGDKFLLTDRSTNGTYVLVDNGPILRICREEVNLVDRGRIAPGQDSTFPITYRIERSE